ncbi:signal peptide peptidase SppA [Granulicella sibirica]|uniref:Signal peptide peptidase SppA, 36K type n=1 Tax=Granulicella sibirica TaxID=2479048 RepID=A0A4Q0T1F2_9BACT|nr:signal peptide peptidase SppA [Granulicella sibirica]RXH55256.1 signal peptide peptidase SppA, 36K type [Granulicella sibirica]
MPEDFASPPPPPPPPPANPQGNAPSGSTFPPNYGPVYGGGYPGAYGRPAYPGYPAALAPRRSGWFWVAVIGGSLAVIALLITAMLWSTVRAFTGTSTTTFNTGSSIAVIDVDGVILDADKVDTQLRKFGDDSSVKAILLHINSPGGGAAASQEIYHEVLRIRQEKHKKIVASVESVGASGAYYIASACDKIYANDASVVGSIGVIMEWTNYGDLMRWAKLKNVIIHAGELKDAGDPSRDLTPKEQAYFQSLVDNMYGQFIHDVAEGRHTTDDKIRPLATGQVWTGQQSLPLGLIDKVGGYRIALMDTAKDVGISGEPDIVKPSTKKGLSAFLNGDADDLFPTPGKILNQAPGFYFMWK